MKAIWLQNRELSFHNEIPIPEPLEDECLIKVIRAGICNTDLELVKGYYPYTGIPGHEFVGIVESGPAHLVGKRVVGDINATCGHCSLCCSGNRTHCENRTVLGIVNRNGAFSEYFTLPTNNLFEVPESVTTDFAAFTEPLAAALEIQQQINIDAGQKVLVIGDGKLGLLISMSLSLTGCDLLVIGKHPEKLAILQGYGITTVDISSGGIANHSFDICVECTGNPEGFASARRAVRPRGTIIMKSTYANSLNIDISSIVVDEITIIGSRCGPFDKALQVLEEGRLDLSPLIHARFPLSHGLQAFDKAAEKGTLKVLIDFE